MVGFGAGGFRTGLAPSLGDLGLLVAGLHADRRAGAVFLASRVGVFLYV